MNRSAFTLIELLVVVAIIALLISILMPSLQICKEDSRRAVCAANVKCIGTACAIYQQANRDVFPTAAHKLHAGAAPIIHYVGNMGGGPDSAATPMNPARNVPSSQDAKTGTTTLSTTRSLWLLVRDGSIVPRSFICPTANDTVDPTVDVASFYDFIGFGTCSYGYQIPYDSANRCKPGVDVNPRMVLLADRGPWSTASATPAHSGLTGGSTGFFVDDWLAPALADALFDRIADPAVGEPVTDLSPPDAWRPMNSPNHGGLGQGQGQSMLYPDGHVAFQRTPIHGVDGDNIYTRINAAPGQHQPFREALQWGEMPNTANAPLYPGHGSLGTGFDAATDSLIWP